MSNVLDDTKQQQVLALGRLGWLLRRIEEATFPFDFVLCLGLCDGLPPRI